MCKLLYPRSWCGRKTAFTEAMLLQWRMHRNLYALYFVNMTCISPKYILSYLITQLKSTCCCCCSNAATAIDLPSLQFHIWLDQQRGNMLPTHIHPTQLRDCWSVTLDRDLVLKDNQRRRNNYQLSKQ